MAPGFVRDINADKVEFTFKKPKSLEIGGSYSIHCVTKRDLNVDLFLHLPKVCCLFPLESYTLECLKALLDVYCIKLYCNLFTFHFDAKLKCFNLLHDNIRSLVCK